jgi:hypothetical protein
MEETQLTLEDIAKTQGTRLQDLPPWMTYAASFDEKLDPKLEEEIKLYSEKRHEKSSSQNEEELCKQKEINDELGKQYAWLSPEEYKEFEPRIGKPLSHADFINKLRNECKLKCFFVEHPQLDKLTLLVQKDEVSGLEVGCWTAYGVMPEYSLMAFDSHGVPLSEKYRGWRTCTLQLILKGFLTEEIVDKVFGKAHGPSSDRYLSTLYAWRNREVEVV